MVNLNEVYNRVQTNKKERNELKKIFKDELSHNEGYQEILEEMKTLKERKKSIETETMAAALADANEIDDLSNEIKHDTELLADIALNMYVNGDTVAVENLEGTKFLPQFSVKFVRDESGEYAEPEKAPAVKEEVVAEETTEAEEKVLEPA